MAELQTPGIRDRPSAVLGASAVLATTGPMHQMYFVVEPPNGTVFEPRVEKRV